MLIISVFIDKWIIFFVFFHFTYIRPSWLSTLKLSRLFEVLQIGNLGFLMFKFTFKILVDTTSFKHICCNLSSMIFHWIHHLLLMLGLLLLKHLNLLFVHLYHVGFGGTYWVTVFLDLVKMLLHLKCLVTFVVGGGVSVILNRWTFETDRLHLRQS